MQRLKDVLYTKRTPFKMERRSFCLNRKPPALLVVMQLAPLVGIVAGAYGTGANQISKYALTDEGMYEYASEDNIFVFVS